MQNSETRLPLADESQRIALRNILMATDFSSCSEAALDYALSVARRYDAQLYVAHVVLADTFQPAPLGAEDLTASQAIRRAEQQMAELLVSGKLRGIPHRVLLGQGALWGSLEEMIRANEVDLVVVGTHGRTGMRKLVLGSVAEEIFRRAPCPVMTVGPQVSSAAPQQIDVRRILLPTDFSPASQRAAAYAFSLAQEFAARITLLHVVEESSAETARELELLRGATLERLLKSVPQEAELWCEPELAVHFGPRAERILAAAEQDGADLIVMGVRRTAHFPGHLPPATAYRVVRQAHCPVLTVQH